MDKKLWYIETMEYYLVLKRNEVLSHEKTRRKFKCTLLSERSQFEKILYDSNYMAFWRRQNYGDSEKISGCQEFGKRER